MNAEFVLLGKCTGAREQVHGARRAAAKEKP
jgi:hypothetical protein